MDRLWSNKSQAFCVPKEQKQQRWDWNNFGWWLSMCSVISASDPSSTSGHFTQRNNLSPFVRPFRWLLIWSCAWRLWLILSLFGHIIHSISFSFSSLSITGSPWWVIFCLFNNSLKHLKKYVNNKILDWSFFQKI